MKLFLQKNAKFLSAGGFAPKPPLASRGWGLRPQTPQTAPPLRISGYAPIFLYHKGCKIVLKVISYDVVNDS